LTYQSSRVLRLPFLFVSVKQGKTSSEKREDATITMKNLKNHKSKFKTNRSCSRMNTREMTEEYRLSHWAQIMRERSESGLSIKAFCKTAGFHENVYYYWQRKLREAACKELSTKAGQKTGGSARSLVPQGWAAVCEQAEPTGHKALVVEVGEYRVRVETDVDTALLAKVFRTLKSLC
jgi:hypothetical protein